MSYKKFMKYLTREEILKIINSKDEVELIKSLFELQNDFKLEQPDIKSIISILEDSNYSHDENDYEKVEKMLEKCLENIGTRIKKQDYEFILEQENSLKKDIFANALKFSKDIQSVKKYLEDERCNWSQMDKIEILEKSKNKELIEEYLKKEKFSAGIWKRLVLATGDKEFIKEACANNLAYGLEEDIRNDDFFICEVIESVLEPQMLEETKNITDPTELIMATKDIDFMKKCINTNNNFDIPKLLLNIGDKTFIKESISNIESKDAEKVLIKMNDKELIKECIEDKSIEWSETQLKNLFLATEDVQYIIENWILKEIDEESRTKTRQIFVRNV